MTASDPAHFERELLERLRLPARDAGPAPLPRRSAVAAILRPGAAEVLLMTRARHERDPWSGHVALPGGRREPHDQDLLATAVRETREEVGLDLAAGGTLLARLSAMQVWARGKPIDMDVTPFVFRLEGRAEPIAGPEADEVFWLPLERAARGEFDDEYRYEHGGVVRRLPCWRFEGRTVWGLTHRLLCGLVRARHDAGARRAPER